ncbi:MAG: ferrous iron transport protein B, partial [Candidatus Omnitrophica bacterium]|nr:ferrous iron transport protein B [Candidatus Omnitrophota bacterium]
AFAIIFPIVTAFFLFFGILEDSGYLPRLTVLSNRVFNTMGLNGRAILPMVLGLGCGTMATLTTRILETKKERILVSLLLSLAIPCSAQLGVIMGLLGSLSINALLIWLAVILSTMIMVGFFASKIIPGSRMPFVQEIPPIRMPQIENIVVKTFTRLKWYLKEAVPLFILGTFILFVLHKIGTLKWLELVLSPLVVGLLSLPEKASEAFIIGFLRRDYGAAGLYMLKKTGALDNIQVLVSLVVITLFVPCIAQFFVTIKERGAKIACLIGGFVFIFASLTGFVLNLVLRYLINNLGIAII